MRHLGEGGDPCRWRGRGSLACSAACANCAGKNVSSRGGLMPSAQATGLPSGCGPSGDNPVDMRSKLPHAFVWPADLSCSWAPLTQRVSSQDPASASFVSASVDSASVLLPWQLRALVDLMVVVFTLLFVSAGASVLSEGVPLYKFVVVMCAVCRAAVCGAPGSSSSSSFGGSERLRGTACK